MLNSEVKELVKDVVRILLMFAMPYLGSVIAIAWQLWKDEDMQFHVAANIILAILGTFVGVYWFFSAMHALWIVVSRSEYND